MRWLSAVIVGLVLLAARDAWATCGGCCDNQAELLGWSKDGRTIAVRETMEGQQQTVIYRDGNEVERWGGGGSEELCRDIKPAMPANTFARHAILPLAASWRTAFRASYRVIDGKLPVIVNGSKCTGHDIVDASNKVIASAVKACDPNETDCVTGRVLGGYVHPSKSHLLIKTTVQSCGFSSHTSYRLVKL